MKILEHGKDTISIKLIDNLDGTYTSFDEAILSILEKREPKKTHQDVNKKCLKIETPETTQ